jgi:hypothetical protein
VPAESQVKYISKGETPLTGPCAGGTVPAPKAQAGYLCVYESYKENNPTVVLLGVANALGELGKASTTGAQVEFEGVPEGTVNEAGTWAVTAN